MRKRILLGHLNSMGDCLFATVIARQIKEVDYPNCHLTWAINGKSRQAVELNPYIDDIWEVATEKNTANLEEWANFAAEAEKRKERGDFDEVFLTQITGDNNLNYDGGIRSSTYNNYPHKISVPHQPTMRLSAAEVENVRRFAEKNSLEKYDKVILVECGPDSFAVALNAPSAFELAREITAENANYAFILSSNKQIASNQANIIDGSRLTFRENAELTKYCDLFIGCASGISWLATTDWAKKLNMILMINRNNAVFPSMIFDHKNIGLSVNHLIEINDNGEKSLVKLKKCLQTVLQGDFIRARNLFNENIKSGNLIYLKLQLEAAMYKSSASDFFFSLRRYVKRSEPGIIFTREFGRMIQSLLSRKVLDSLKGLKSKNKTLELL